jgi:hypothetical protein
MDINYLIPDKDSNWICKHNILYYKKFALIPLAKNINGDLFINLDKRCVKSVIRLLNHCNKLGIDYMFCDYHSIYEDFIMNESIDSIFFNNLMILEEPKIFQLIKSNKLNFIKIICNFIKLYQCQNNFIRTYDDLRKSHFDQSWFDWYDKKTHFRVEDKEVREYYESLFREVKISLLLSED